jgi:hypothetical protein
MFQTKTGRPGGRARRTSTAVALVAGLSGATTAIGVPAAFAASVSAGPLCDGYSACSGAPYTTHNFQNENTRSYWGVPPDQDTAPSGARANCTHDSVYPLQAPGTGVSVTSVSVAGNYILWGERMPDGYKVDGYDNGNVVSVPTSSPPVDVQGDAGAWYWGDSDLERFTF